MAERGMFLAFEGPDGAGKSSVVRGLCARLRAKSREVVLVREPGGTPLAEAVRQVILSFGDWRDVVVRNPEILAEAHRLWTGAPSTPTAISLFGEQLLRGEMVPKKEEFALLLFSIARSDLVTQTIRPALESGSVVLADRFNLSTRVYQGDVGGVSEEVIERITQRATGGLEPDYVFVLNLEEEEAFRRMRVRGELDEFETPEHWRRVRDGYIRRALENPSRFRVLSADGTPDEVEEAVYQEFCRVDELHRRSCGRGARSY